MSEAAHQTPVKAPLNELSASDIVRAVASGETTCEAVTRACLDRIAARDGEVKAWVNLDPEHALAQARARDKASSQGPLHGVPIGVKDVLDTFDLPTEMGSPIYQGHRPAADAAVVALVRAAGAVILGKTVTCEFAGVTPNVTTNPLNPDHTPGGSSSGSGAAVADFMTPVAFGTQTGGSILRPASYCGVIGYKPTFGSFNVYGMKPAAQSLDTIGLLTRSIDDLALLRAVLVGRKPAAPAKPSTPPRIGFCRTHLWGNAQPETVDAIEDAAKRLNDAGCKIADVTLPQDFVAMSDARGVINDYERAMSTPYEWAHHRDTLSDGIKRVIEQGYALPHETYVATLKLMDACRAQLDALFGDADILLAPCVRGEAPKGHASTGDPSFQAMWTMLHVPTMALPTAFGPNGLPVGIQLIARRYDDDRLLAASHWIYDRLIRRAH